MNRDQILHHLKEARDAIDTTIGAIQADAEYEFGNYWVDMQHIYHHINTAWNSRDASPTEIAASTDADFTRWSALPADLPMMEAGGSA